MSLYRPVTEDHNTSGPKELCLEFTADNDVQHFNDAIITMRPKFLEKCFLDKADHIALLKHCDKM